MAKPNYSFEKRQRDIQKQQKKAEKLAKKAAAKEESSVTVTPVDGEPAQATADAGDKSS